jgi:hypothetical protein
VVSEISAKLMKILAAGKKQMVAYGQFHSLTNNADFSG